MAQYESEWPRLIETAHVGQLHQKQERRRGGLEASHDRVRSEFEQRPDLDRSKEAWKRPPTRIVKKKTTRTNVVLGGGRAVSEWTRPYRNAPRKNVLLIRGAYTVGVLSPRTTLAIAMTNAA